MSVLIALSSGVLWGCADFGGGFLAGRIPSILVTFVVGLFGLLGLSAFIVATQIQIVGGGAILFGVLAGMCAPAAILCYYKALAAGPMGIVAALSSTGIVVPITVGVLYGDRLNVLQAAGLVLVVIGIVVATIPAPSAFNKLGTKTLMLALVSALGFGTMLTLYAAGARVSVTSTLFFQRVTFVAILGAFVVLSRGGVRFRPRNIPIAAGVGIGAVGASGLYAIATQIGAVSISAVLASLSPVVTLALARMILQQRLSGLQTVGGGAAIAGVLILAAQ